MVALAIAEMCAENRLGEDEAAALVVLTKRLAHFVDTIGKYGVQSADTLLRCIG